MVRTGNRTGHGQWLLLAALLLGIFAMHTLGHPSGSHSSGGHSSGGHASERYASGEHSSSGGHGAGHAIAVAASHHAGATGDAVQEARPEPPSPDGATGTGMDMEPLSVCLAVLLGAFTLVLLVRAGLARPGGTLARAPATGRPSAPRPEAPPPRFLLARLSVLRI